MHSPGNGASLLQRGDWEEGDAEARSAETPR
jgi:hypothetical protein